MRPYFFHRPTVPADKRSEQYRARQRERADQSYIGQGWPRSFVLGVLGLLGGLFGAREELAAWLRVSDTGLPIRIVKSARDKSLAAAQAKRERRKKKAIAQVMRSGDGLWKISWANDKTWRRT